MTAQLLLGRAFRYSRRRDASSGFSATVLSAAEPRDNCAPSHSVAVKSASIIKTNQVNSA